MDLLQPGGQIRRFPRRPRQQGLRRQTFRPAVEALEGRTLLSGGTLDPTLGQGNPVLIDFGARDFGRRLALQPDGKIIASGLSSSPPSTSSYALARQNPDGTPDTSFGTNGQVVTPFGIPADLTLQADGKIIVAGSGAGQVFGLARYNPNGTPDTTFGSGGFVSSNFTPGANQTWLAVLLLPDGKMVTAGYSQQQLGRTFQPPNLVVARFNPDGTLDTTFAGGGEATRGLGQGDALALQPDGKILVGASSGTAPVLRLNADGSLDASFGTGGLAVVPGIPAATALLLRANGQILVGGPAFGEFGLGQLNPGGTPDAGFNSFHAVVSAYGGRQFTPTRLALVGAEIQVGGHVAVAAGPGYGEDFAVARSFADGSPDTRFAAGGTFLVGVGGVFSSATDVAFQPDGKVVGLASGSDLNLLEVRYVLSATTPTGSSNKQFVSQAYLDLLLRPADPGGLAFWTGRLNQGQATRHQLALRMQKSLESAALVVQTLYGLYLHRAADPGGLTTWSRFLAVGGTREQLRAILLGSDEYFSAHGSTAGGFVQALYEDVLYRAADAGGAQTWGQALSAGVSRGRVAAALLARREGAGDEVQGLYHEFFHRPADPGGLNVFASRPGKGIREEKVIAILLASPEYAARL